ncbi:DUF3558 family protein [Nonomuraea fastidiosa]|jgi:hypothetical protein|uniref:DUF3558 family protein n=1 Tax=Nonomuraea TaxID=83681 RepID=UPI003250CA19
MALLVALCAVSACGAQGGGTSEERPAGLTASATPSATGTPAPTGSASPSSTAVGGKLTLSELARNPCRAIDEEDRLGIVINDSEPNNGRQSCRWAAYRYVVAFIPHTSTDLTKAAKYRHLTRKTISGHRAMLGVSEALDRKMYRLFVSAGKKQSFELQVLPVNEGTQPVSPTTVATRFAKAILSHLR